MGQFTFELLAVHAGPPSPQLSQPPWISGHLPPLPHWMHTVCSHVGNAPAVTAKAVVAFPVACTTPPASTHGVWAHVPASEPAPQSVSVLHGPNVFVASFASVVQSLIATASVAGRLTVWYAPVIAGVVGSMGER